MRMIWIACLLVTSQDQTNTYAMDLGILLKCDIFRHQLIVTRWKGAGVPDIFFYSLHQEMGKNTHYNAQYTYSEYVSPLAKQNISSFKGEPLFFHGWINSQMYFFFSRKLLRMTSGPNLRFTQIYLKLTFPNCQNLKNLEFDFWKSSFWAQFESSVNKSLPSQKLQTPKSCGILGKTKILCYFYAWNRMNIDLKK